MRIQIYVYIYIYIYTYIHVCIGRARPGALDDRRAAAALHRSSALPVPGLGTIIICYYC